MGAEMMPLLEVLKGASDFLAKQGVESPRLNAEHLVAQVLGVKRLELYLQFDRPLGESERAPLRDLIRRRGTGIPLQHLLGSVEFYGRVFRSDARALIPRPETEQLVERVLSLPSPTSILDVATGSGVIAISLALECPDAVLTATDISPEALSLARENASLLGAEGITFLQVDLLPEGADRYDLITANLPYIPTAEIPGLSREVGHDPVLALDGGADGLDLIRRLLSEARARLSSGGRILLEIGQGQAEGVMACLAGHNYRDILPLPDYQGVLRFIEAVHG
jgi:release factor glutamine methyltransferase